MSADRGAAQPKDEVRRHSPGSAVELGGGGLMAAWAGSVILHLALIGLMLLIVFPYAPAPPAREDSVRVQLVGDPDSWTAGPFARVAGAPPTTTTSAQRRIQPRLGEPMLEVARPEQTELSLVGIGTGGADFTVQGATGGAWTAPEFFGLGRSARGVRSVVYVVDRSGSMVDTFIHVRAELHRSISALRRHQRFHVIFFSSGDPLENPPGKLVSGIESQKAAFFDFLQTIQPQGSTHPESSMRRALSLEPDIIYFLTDGEFDPGLLPKLDEWNRDRTIRIFTIAYFDTAGASLLEQIARTHNGEYKFVSDLDLP